MINPVGRGSPNTFAAYADEYHLARPFNSPFRCASWTIDAQRAAKASVPTTVPTTTIPAARIPSATSHSPTSANARPPWARNWRSTGGPTRCPTHAQPLAESPTLNPAFITNLPLNGAPSRKRLSSYSPDSRTISGVVETSSPSSGTSESLPHRYVV